MDNSYLLPNITREEINLLQHFHLRKTLAQEFLEHELKITDAKIISSKMSTNSDILWIEVENSDTAERIIKQSARTHTKARGIMYPPTELYATIKSIENNCKAKKNHKTPN